MSCAGHPTHTLNVKHHATDKTAPKLGSGPSTKETIHTVSSSVLWMQVKWIKSVSEASEGILYWAWQCFCSLCRMNILYAFHKWKSGVILLSACFALQTNELFSSQMNNLELYNSHTLNTVDKHSFNVRMMFSYIHCSQGISL